MQSYFFHFPLVLGKDLPSYGFPFSPSEIERGRVYEFHLNHVLAVDDPLALVRTEWLGPPATAASDEGVPLQRYSPLMAIFHWLIAVLVLLAYVTSEGGARIRLDPPIIHVALGLGALSLTLPRLLVRLLGRVPSPVSTGPRLLKRFASVGHGLLYALLIAVPLTGWLTASRLGLQITLFSVRLPWLIEPNAAEPGLIATVHQVGGNALLVMAALHVVVALWHSFWLRDRTLHRMWPWSGVRPSVPREDRSRSS